MYDLPRAAYIHVPFCSHRCGYCNFTVVAGRMDLAADYLKALELELSQLGSPLPVETLFIGGGTPTELEPHQLRQLMELLNHWLPLESDNEFTIEANPETFDRERADILVAAGINRISLGIQSFDDSKLKRLDRLHGAEASRTAIALAKELFPSVSVDLIFAAPGESLADWQKDVRAAMDFELHHISTYGLTFENGTEFWSRLKRDALVEVDDGLQREMYEWTIDALKSGGYEHYEVSNFAKPNQRCRHNETYWMGREYSAFGPGASRYVNGRRETNHRSTTAYLKRVLNGESPIAEGEDLTELDRAKERLVFGCRRLEGVDVAEFSRDFGMAIDDVAGDAIAKFVELGLMERSDGCLRLTRSGLLVSDSLWPDFL